MWRRKIYDKITHIKSDNEWFITSILGTIATAARGKLAVKRKVEADENNGPNYPSQQTMLSKWDNLPRK
jgi:hypothetical protein